MISSNQHTSIVVVGPTAVGKTAMAVEVARHFQTEIISADSRQCFRELNIGVARPSVDELAMVNHHFIASHSVFDEMNAAVFESYALFKSEEIFHKNNTLVMVGGTGLYIKAYCEGIDDLPATDAEVRDQIISGYEANGMDWLQNQVKEKDPLFYSTGEIQNPQRMMRALEVMEITGKSIRSFQKGIKTERPFRIIKIGLDLPREILYDRINRRVDQMMAHGLLDEVKTVTQFLREYQQRYPGRVPSALQTVGYSELFDHLEGKLSLDEAIEKIKTNTRRYAKRQLTWFRRDIEIKWFGPEDIDDVLGCLTRV